MQRNWPVLADLSKSDLVYPSSCVTSSRSFVKAEPKTVNAFLNAYVSAIQVIKKDQKLAEKSLIKWLRKKSRLIYPSPWKPLSVCSKPLPNVPDKGIENILRDLQNQRPVPKEFFGHPELFRDNGPLERPPHDNQRMGSLLAGMLFVLALMSSPASSQELRRILYGTTASPSHLPIWVAKDAGYFEKAGLNVEPVQIRGGSLISLAIITGDLPFSGAGAESVVAARAAGGDVILLACPVDADPVYLITRPEIKSAQDLKGQASAVTRYGSTTHFYLRAALKHVGLNPDKDMTILQLGAGPEMVIALDHGAIAAAALTTR